MFLFAEKQNSAHKGTSYTVDDVAKALEAVKAGKSVKNVSILYKIPYATLHSRVKGTYSLDVKKGPVLFLVKRKSRN